MSWFTKTLWDLLIRAPRVNAQPSAKATRSRDGAPPRSARVQQRYDSLVAEMKSTYHVRVRKWRTSTTGCAWEVHYHNGRTTRLIEAPYPRGPMSCAIFLHEIGHHAIGFGRHKPRCLEEYHAWKWALDTMRERGFNVTEGVEKRMRESMRYAVEKARRRGLKNLPMELLPYLTESNADDSAAPRAG